MAVARDVTMNGVATSAHETTPNWTPQSMFRTKAPKTPNPNFTPAVRKRPSEMSSAI